MVVLLLLYFLISRRLSILYHRLLINKLNMYGVSGDELCWFMSYLDNRKQAVNIGSSLSSFKNINIGVPQGSILGPLLFLIYVNNLPNCVNCKTVMYADDTTCTLLFRSSHPNSLQEDLNPFASGIPKVLLSSITGLFSVKIR